jgi:hypothetical protein
VERTTTEHFSVGPLVLKPNFMTSTKIV